MSKIFILGSLNTDLCIKCDSIPRKGETIMGKGFFSNAGGKGGNQAVAVSKLGGNAVMLGAVGKDLFGDGLVESLNSYGVNTEHVVRKSGCSTGVAVILLEESDNRIILDSGANYRIDSDSVVQVLTNEASCGDVLVSQLEVPVDVVAEAFETAKKLGMTTILNPAPAIEVNKTLYSFCDFIVPNETEAKTLSNQTEMEKIVRFFFNSGVKNVIITLGDKGSVAYGQEQIIRKKPIPVTVEDTTAAGDTFVGAFAVALTENKQLSEALDFATRAATLTITRSGAQQSIPFRSQVDGFACNEEQYENQSQSISGGSRTFSDSRISDT